MTISNRAALAIACAMLSACGQGSQSNDAASGPAGGAGSPPPAFAACGSCHSISPGRHAAGPSLAGIWGRKAGSQAGYMYTPALKGSGIVWDAQSLDTWLKAPMQMVPGTRMVVGIPDPAGRQAVIAYLQTLK